ncbi:hypothetical protein BC332_12453 [Capsicum chinense]|nr:hypothetical protein BC332_12453 [Capsicum chinense]
MESAINSAGNPPTRVCRKAASSNETDQQALLAFKNLVTSSSHVLADNWTKNTSFCSWFSVTCSPKRQRVVALELPNIFHDGIPFGLGHFPLLRVIDVRNNQLQGSIPTSLFQHQRVPKISLAFNKLGGEIWTGPWYVPELRALNLGNNSLTGIIPSSVGNATKLINFSLAGNRIRGNLPKEIGNLSQLAFLSLYDNQLTGSISTSLFNISSLVTVSLALNRLSGSLLLNEGNIVSNLEFLSVSNNQISGCIPSNICQLRELQVLGYFNISSLERITVNFNNLSGTVPAATDLHLPNLKLLLLGENQLEGETPLFITNASKIEAVGLENNFLKGTIPTNLGNLRELRGLFLTSNQLMNEPREHELQFFNSLADCRMLRYLEVGYNPLNGILPNSIGNLSSTTEAVNLADAHISGFIPASTGNISCLITLVFKNNNLMGNIPSEIGKLKQLQGLSLSNNKLQRHISEAVCHLSNLVKLFLQVNELSGEIPECIGNLSMLLDLWLGSNKFSSKIPLSLWKMSGLLYFDVSRNSIEGELKAILELNLSSNNLSGVIPSRLGELLHLQYLDLSNNSFSGQIPFSFSNLISIEYWDLSLYDLSGTIPKSLKKLSYLKSINVSYNVLDGEIPSGGVFANSTLQSFVGNKGLCGMHILEVLPCPITKSGQQSKSKKLVLKIVIPVVTSSFMIFLLVPIWIMKRKKIATSKDVEKVLDLENEQVCKKFDTECEVMRNVRHRNLIPVITTCSSEYIRAFVLQYILMLDAAMAIEYLHHGNETPIVHCDLKPSNILLDEDMVAHVGDFGISKILALRHHVDGGTIMEVVDANVFLEEEQITSKGEICIAAMVELALDCTKENPESRITMKDVVKRLNKIKNTFLET